MFFLRKVSTKKYPVLNVTSIMTINNAIVFILKVYKSSNLIKEVICFKQVEINRVKI